jgi:hypothetical protein
MSQVDSRYISIVSGPGLLLRTTSEASATGVATPQSEAATPTPKPSTIDIIKQPSLLRQKLAGNCTTTCQWIGRQQFCNTTASNVIVLSADPSAAAQGVCGERTPRHSGETLKLCPTQVWASLRQKEMFALNRFARCPNNSHAESL